MTNTAVLQQADATAITGPQYSYAKVIAQNIRNLAPRHQWAFLCNDPVKLELLQP